AGRLRHRADHRRGAVERTGRLGPVLRLAQGGAAHRPGHHRLLLRRQTHRPGTCPGRVHRCCAGRCSRPPSAPPGPAHRTTPTTGGSPTGSAADEPLSRWPARWSAGRITPCAPSATGPSPRPETPPRPEGGGARICPPTDARGPLLHVALPIVPTSRNGPERLSGRPSPRDTPE